VRINLGIRKNGSLDKVELVRGSGNSVMDESLVLAIRKAAPFPKFPDDVTAEKLLIRANFIVADVPSGPITVVSRPVETIPASASASAESDKKLMWGQAAGHASVKTKKKAAGKPAPKSKKEVKNTPRKSFRWGAAK
jgi:TonB family protein